MNPIHLTLLAAVLSLSGMTSARISLSLYALDLGATSSQVGLLFASIYFFPLILSWPIGRLTDRYGTRGLMILGQAIGTIAMVIPWAWQSMAALYIAGLLVGLNFAFTAILVLNVMGLLSTKEERARNFSNNSLMGSLSHAAGPLMAGLAIDAMGFAQASLCSAALSFASLAAVALWGGAWPAGSGPRQEGTKGSLRERLADRASLNIVLVSCIVQTGADLFAFYLPIYGHGLGLSASVIGAVLACVFSAVCLARVIMPWLIDKLGRHKLLLYAQFIAAAGFLLLPLFEHPVMLGLIGFVFGLGTGYSQPLTMTMLFDRAPPGRSGETVALRQTANNVARLVSPPLFGAIATVTGLWGVFMLSALLMGAGGLATAAGGSAAKAQDTGGDV